MSSTHVAKDPSSDLIRLLLAQEDSLDIESIFFKVAKECNNFANFTSRLRRVINSLVDTTSILGSNSSAQRHVVELFHSSRQSNNSILIIPKIVDTHDFLLLLINYYLTRFRRKIVLIIGNPARSSTLTSLTELMSAKKISTLWMSSDYQGHLNHHGNSESSRAFLLLPSTLCELLSTSKLQMSQISLIVVPSTTFLLDDNEVIRSSWASIMEGRNREPAYSVPQLVSIWDTPPDINEESIVRRKYDILFDMLERPTMAKISSQSYREHIAPLLKSFGCYVFDTAPDQQVLNLRSSMVNLCQQLLRIYFDCSASCAKFWKSNTVGGPASTVASPFPQDPLESSSPVKLEEWLQPLQFLRHDPASWMTDLGCPQPNIPLLVSHLFQQWKPCVAKIILQNLLHFVEFLTLLFEVGAELAAPVLSAQLKQSITLHQKSITHPIPQLKEEILLPAFQLLTSTAFHGTAKLGKAIDAIHQANQQSGSATSIFAAFMRCIIFFRFRVSMGPACMQLMAEFPNSNIFEIGHPDSVDDEERINQFFSNDIDSDQIMLILIEDAELIKQQCDSFRASHASSRILEFPTASFVPSSRTPGNSPFTESKSTESLLVFRLDTTSFDEDRNCISSSPNGSVLVTSLLNPSTPSIGSMMFELTALKPMLDDLIVEDDEEVGASAASIPSSSYSSSSSFKSYGASSSSKSIPSSISSQSASSSGAVAIEPPAAPRQFAPIHPNQTIDAWRGDGLLSIGAFYAGRNLGEVPNKFDPVIQPPLSGPNIFYSQAKPGYEASNVKNPQQPLNNPNDLFKGLIKGGGSTSPRYEPPPTFTSHGSSASAEADPISYLQIHFSKLGIKVSEVESTGPDHKREFRYVYSVPASRDFLEPRDFYGTGNTKKDAKKNAAAATLAFLTNRSDTSSSSSGSSSHFATHSGISSKSPPTPVVPVPAAATTTIPYSVANPVGAVNEYCQKQGLKPSYIESDRAGPDHDPTFSVTLVLPSGMKFNGIGATKKVAKTLAATAACQYLSLK